MIKTSFLWMLKLPISDSRRAWSLSLPIIVCPRFAGSGSSCRGSTRSMSLSFREGSGLVRSCSVIARFMSLHCRMLISSACFALATAPGSIERVAFGRLAQGLRLGLFFRGGPLAVPRQGLRQRLRLRLEATRSATVWAAVRSVGGRPRLRLRPMGSAFLLLRASPARGLGPFACASRMAVAAGSAPAGTGLGAAAGGEALQCVAACKAAGRTCGGGAGGSIDSNAGGRGIPRRGKLDRLCAAAVIGLAAMERACALLRG